MIAIHLVQNPQEYMYKEKGHYLLQIYEGLVTGNRDVSASTQFKINQMADVFEKHMYKI